jgi:glutamyl-tRNA synthetase
MTTVRFAPSPTGLIHLGNLRTALINWLFAGARSGSYILRFDDTDLERSTEAFAQGIREDLAWIGIEPDAVVHQSSRIALYDNARDRLIADGRLYPCYETPDELDRRRARARAMGRPPIYDRAALKLTEDDRKKLEAEGRRPHWRFRLDGKPVVFDDLIRGEQTVNTASMSDPVLVREDGSYLYTLPSVVDDIDLEITHVIRGEDHISNTGTQIEIFEALGGTPPTFGHHNLLTDETGQGLSKRLGSLSIAHLREDGFEPLAVAIMAVITGTSLPIEPCESLDALAADFALSAISHGPARYDPADLVALNARLLHAMPYEKARERLAARGLDDPALWTALRENLGRFADIEHWAGLVNGPVTPIVAEEDREFIAAARELLPEEPYDETTFAEWTKAIKQRTGRKGRALFRPLRLALTGREDGPELKALLPLLGRKASLDRLS